MLDIKENENNNITYLQTSKVPRSILCNGTLLKIRKVLLLHSVEFHFSYLILYVWNVTLGVIVAVLARIEDSN